MPKVVHNVFDNMEFPPYQFREYPKHIPDPSGDKPFLVVNDAEEERAAKGGERVVDEEFERTRLLKVAEIKGVTVDGRWGIKRLRQTIEAAGEDPNLDPYK